MHQENQADHGHHDGLFDECQAQRGDRSANQLGAIIGWHEPNAFGQRELAYLSLDRFDHLECIGAEAHDDDAACRISASIPIRGPAANLGAEMHIRDVAHANRNPARGDAHNALLDVVERAHVAAATHDVFPTCHFEHASPDLGIGIAHGADHVGGFDAERGELVGIEQHLILAFIAAQRCHLRHAFRALQGGAHREVLQCAHLGEIPLASGVFENVLEYPSDAARVGSERRDHACRHLLLNAADLLKNTGARPIDVSIFSEDRIDEAHAEHRVAAHCADARRALQCANQWIGDLVFDEIGASAHPLAVHDHLRIGEIGDGVEWGLASRVDGPKR